MLRAGRSALVLAVLAVVLAGAAIWGWSAATAPFPGKVDSPLCESRPIKAGTKVFPQDVTVSVYNAGTRSGLAGRTMQELTDQGFTAGEDGNVRLKNRVATQIWTDDPGSPAVRLVASRLKPRPDVQRRKGPGVGVVVVVGDGFRDVVKGRQSVVAKKDTTICSRPVE